MAAEREACGRVDRPKSPARGGWSVSTVASLCPASWASLFAVVLGGRLTVAQTPPFHLAGRTKRHAGHSHLGSLADKGQLVRTNGQVDLPPSLPTSDTEM